MVGALIALLAGALLLADSLGKFSGGEKLVRALRPYQTVIGILALTWGAFHIFSLLGIVLLLGGIILGANALVTVPRDICRAPARSAINAPIMWSPFGYG